MKQRILFLMVALVAMLSVDSFAQGPTLVQLIDIKGGVNGDIAYTNAGGKSAWGAPSVLGILTNTTVLGGDLSGTLPNPTVVKIRTTPVSATAPTLNQVLKFDGTNYVPSNLPVAQVLSLATNTLTLSGGGGSVSLAPYLDNTDAQTLTFTNATKTLAISGGNSVVLPGTTKVATEAFWVTSGNTVTLATAGLPSNILNLHTYRPFRLQGGAGKDFTISGQVLTFTQAFASTGEWVTVDIFN
jgi:hypothetical protein